MQRRILAIGNPIAGRGHAVRLVGELEELARLSGVQIDSELTRAAGHGRELAAAARGDHYDAVAAVGGDGTINEIVNGLGANGPPLLVIPCGTGNVLAKEIGASRTVLDYVDAIRAWRVHRRDLGRLGNGRLFTCFVGAGFDGQCTRSLAERKGRIHIAQYVPIMWKAIQHSDFRTLEVDAGTDARERGVSYALVSITPEYGGRIWLTSEAQPDDGRFDVLTVHERIAPLALLKLLAHAALRRLGRVRSTKFFRSSQVRIRADEEVPIQVDGDFAGFLPIQAEILPNALRYFRAR
jgi:diacylglycerol kinase family enzyme